MDGWMGWMQAAISGWKNFRTTALQQSRVFPNRRAYQLLLVCQTNVVSANRGDAMASYRIKMIGLWEVWQELSYLYIYRMGKKHDFRQIFTYCKSS